MTCHWKEFESSFTSKGNHLRLSYEELKQAEEVETSMKNVFAHEIF